MILDQINADVVATMKDRDPARKDENALKILTLRTLLAEAKKFKVDGPTRQDPGDTEMAGIIAKAIKQFKETLDNAMGKNAAGVVREDIAAQERAKIAIVEKYLPKQMEKAEIEALVAAAIAQAGASSPKDMGAVMAIVRPQTQGKADGKLVSEIVKAKLSAG